MDRSDTEQITIDQAAAVANVPARVIRQAIQEGRLQRRMLAGVEYVTRQDLARLFFHLGAGESEYWLTRIIV